MSSLIACFLTYFTPHGPKVSHKIAQLASVPDFVVMAVTDPSSWASAVNLRVKVHPVVLFQIADAYERRSMENHRVIGTLVGE